MLYEPPFIQDEPPFSIVRHWLYFLPKARKSSIEQYYASSSSFFFFLRSQTSNERTPSNFNVLSQNFVICPLLNTVVCLNKKKS